MPSEQSPLRLMEVCPNDKRSLLQVLEDAARKGYDGILLKWSN